MKPPSSLDPFHEVRVTLWKRPNEDVGFMETVLHLIFRKISKHFEILPGISTYFEIIRNIKRRTVSMKPASSLDPFHEVRVTLWKRSNEDVGFMEAFLRFIFRNISEYFEMFLNVSKYFEMLNAELFP